MEEIFQQLGRRIRELRIQRGFKSQEEFAEYCNVHRTFVGHLETGRKDFRLSTIIKVAGALGVTMSELFTPFEDKHAVKTNSSAIFKADADAVLRELSALEKAVQRAKRHLSGETRIEPNVNTTTKKQAKNR